MGPNMVRLFRFVGFPFHPQPLLGRSICRLFFLSADVADRVLGKKNRERTRVNAGPVRRNARLSFLPCAGRTRAHTLEKSRTSFCFRFGLIFVFAAEFLFDFLPLFLQREGSYGRIHPLVRSGSRICVSACFRKKKKRPSVVRQKAYLVIGVERQPIR